MAQKIHISLLILSSILLCIQARPGGVAVAGSASLAKPLLSFGEGGNVGVNFGGYSASAGLGGLLSGDATRGGLHAEAGTPHGQAAAAGLGGGVGGGGYAAGGLYAGATAGGGVSAGSTLTGVSGSKVIYQPEQVLSEKTVTEAERVVYEQKLQSAPVVHRTIIEKTVIPNYVEKTIQVPSYVEKTIRVPTTIEKKVRVEAAPTIYEKTIEVPAQHGVASGGVVAGGHVGRVNTYSYPTGGFLTNLFGGGGGASYGGGGASYGGGGAIGGGGYTGGAGVYGGGGAIAGGGGGGGGATFVAQGYKQTNPNLFNDIFNIPISALGAVNNLLNNFGGRASGGFAVSKGYSAGGY